MLTIVPATPAHAEAIELRPGDHREIAALGLSPPDGVARSLARSLWAETYLVDGEVAAIAGLAVANVLGSVGSPWLVTGRPVDRRKKLFLRETRRRVERMTAEFPVLVSHVHADYSQAIAWMRWLGFMVGPPQPYGPMGSPFRRAMLASGPLTIGPGSIDALAAAPTIDALLLEYAEEGAIDGLPRPWPRWDLYRAIEARGHLHVIAAEVAGQLVGFITVLTAPLPRYTEPVAMSESFFVARAHRKSGAGLKLLRAAEAKARALGAQGLLVSAPSGGTLAEVLPRVGYRETNRAFFRTLGHA
jgi:GNAT superfamily N-acetyltransferase